MMDADQVRRMLQSACAEAGSERAWAMQNGMSQALVNLTIRGDREPAVTVLEALGLERVVQYREIKK